MAATEGDFPISEISTYQAKWVIRARITSKGPLRSFNNKRGGDGKVFHVELLDSQGGEIRASFFNEVAEKYFQKLEVGKVYRFSKGSVKVANRQYNNTNHRYEIVFEKLTQVEDAEDDSNIDSVKFVFVDLRTVQTKNVPFTADLCGVIMSAGPIVTFTSKEGKPLVKREIVLVDDSATSMCITLWGERAQKADSEFQGNPMVAMKGVVVKEWQQGRNGSLMEAGQLVFNPELGSATKAAAAKVLDWWSNGGSSQNVTQLSQAGVMGGSRAPMGKPMNVASMRRAAEMVGDQQETYSIVSRLVIVQFRKQGETLPLTYMACMEAKEGNKLPCNKRLDSGGYCASCSRAGKAAPKLTLRCSFADYSGSCWLTTFHEGAQRAIAMSADEVSSLENSSGRESVEASIKRGYFKQPLQVTVRAKLDSYNGDIRTNVVGIDVSPVNRRQHGRQLLAEIQEMLY